MRTSPSQFEVMVNFMIEHGDLSKPSTNARGRMASFQHWEELTDLLNSDGSGDSRPAEKWRKVWSDFKNNTKRKAARIHRAATGTGGGSANYAHLNDLELKVLNLIGLQAATGLPVEEAGLSQEIELEIREEQEELQDPPPVPRESETSSERIFDIEYYANEPGPSRQPLAPPSPTPTGPASSRADVQMDSNPVSDAARTPRTPSPSASQPRVARGRPTQPGHPRRRARLSRTEQAAENFLNADGAWRAFRIEQQRNELEMRREQIRIREMELDMQRDWHNATLSAIDLLRKLVDRFCRD